MINRRHICSLMMLALFAGLAGNTAAQTRDLSLDEAIKLSLQHSNQLKLDGARIAEATAVVKQAKEKRLPDASITGSYLRLNQPDVDLKLKLGQQGTGSGETETPGTTSTVAVSQAAYAIANVSLALFSGFRIQYGIESAKYLEQAARLDAAGSREEVVANTIAAYANLYKAHAAVALVAENLKQSQQRAKELSGLEKNGMLARNELLKAQLQQSNIELTLLDAQNSWKMANINMDLMLGLPAETELNPDDASFQQVTDERGYTDWENLALQNRKDLTAMDYRVKAAGSAVKAAKGEYYPSLAMTGGYIAAHVPNLITITNAVNIGVGLSYSPSSLWKAGAGVAAARSREQQAAISRDLMTDAVRLELAQAYQAYLSSRKKIEVYDKAVEQADENYRIVKNKYDNNLASTSDLLEADVAKLQAALNFTSARADAVVAYKKLMQTAGILADKTN